MLSAMPDTQASVKLRERVRRLLQAKGLQHGAKLLGVSDRTAARVAAGLAVRAGTIALVEREIEQLDRREATGNTSAA